MTKAENAKKNECIRSQCTNLDRCLLYHGCDCQRLGGRKIPKVNISSSNYFNKPQKTCEPASKFKPYFIEAPL